MLSDLRALEDAKALFLTLAAPNAVHVQDGGMCGQAGPDCGECIVSRPLRDLREALPVKFVAEGAIFGSVPVTIRPSSRAFSSDVTLA